MFVIRFLPVVLGALLTFGNRADAADAAKVADRYPHLAPHPRLFWPESATAALKESVAHDPVSGELMRAFVADGQKMLKAAPAQRIMEGKRLLGVSREAINRIWLLSFLYRLTGQPEYLQRAEKEMLAVADFKDWNPSHFLDVAEMTAGMALGYDWLYDQLPPASRERIRDAIRDKGVQLAFSREGLSATSQTSNWNSVCNGGVSLGALAIAEDAPELCQRLLQRSVDQLPRALAAYAPDGVYPEGPGYWDYGTMYNVLLMEALQTSLGTDFGLSQAPGFRQSPLYMLQGTGPSGRTFNYSDGPDTREVLIEMYWFARLEKLPALGNAEDAVLTAALAKAKADGHPAYFGRFDPFILLWRDPPAAGGAPPLDLPLAWRGRGQNPVAFLRTSWDPRQETYVAIKAGSASQSHGHMDNGSFVLDAYGMRWAADPNRREYIELESAGVDYWNSRQDSPRWRVFESGPFSHNTLTIDGQLHNVGGKADFIRFSDKPDNEHAVVDLTDTLKGQVSKATRGFALRSGGVVLVQDELEGLKPGAEVRWSLFTPAQAQVAGSRAILTQGGKTLGVEFVASPGLQLAVEEMTVDETPYRRPIAGYRQLVARVKSGADGRVRIAAFVTPKPGELLPALESLPPPEQWSPAP